MKKIRKELLGYGVGCIGQGAAYMFMTSYFVVFMTNCVGVSSSFAGMIMSVSLFVEVFAGIMVGNLSDHCSLKMGRRKPFFLFGSISMPIILFLLFNTISGSMQIKILYYLILSILFRISFCSYEIPYEAFGAEITKDYDERTRLMTISRAGSILGNFAAYVMPLWILELFIGREEEGWHAIGMLIGGVCLVSWFGGLFFAKERPMQIKQEKQKNLLSNILMNYKELLRLKATKILVMYKIAFAVAFALFNVANLYYMKYSLHLDNRFTSYIYFFSIVVFVIATPIVDKTAIRLGKARQQMYMMAGAGICALLIFFFARQSFWGGVLYVLVFSLAQTSFWQLSLSIFFDLAEVDEFVYGKRREGEIMSMVSVLGTAVSAVIVQLFGILFDFAGFDPQLQVQGDGTVFFLNISFMLVPGICFLLAAAALRAFPINKYNFSALTDAVALKREEKNYQIYLAEIEKIIK